MFAMPSIIAFENTFVNGVTEKTWFYIKKKSRETKIEFYMKALVFGVCSHIEQASDMSYDRFLISTIQLIVAARLPKVTGIMKRLQRPMYGPVHK